MIKFDQYMVQLIGGNMDGLLSFLFFCRTVLPDVALVVEHI